MHCVQVTVSNDKKDTHGHTEATPEAQILREGKEVAPT